MKSLLLLVYLLTAFFVSCFVWKSFRRQELLGAKVGKILVCCLIITLGYSVNLMTDQYFLMSCGNTAVFIGIDFMLIYYAYYLYEFLRFKGGHLKLVMKVLGAFGLIDCVILLINPFHEIALTYKEYTYLGIKLYEYIPFFWYKLHLLFCYIVILIICILLIFKCMKIPSLYWYRYLLLFVSTGVTVGANALFLMAGLKIDFSVLIYGLNALSIYFVTFIRVPDVILSNVHKTMLSCLDSPMILFDCENFYVESNEDLRNIFTMIDFNRNTMALDEFIEKTGLSQVSIDAKESMSFQWKCTAQNKIFECKCIILKSKRKIKKGTLLIFHDITSLIEAYEGEENARKANYAKTAFLANMSHEIRTPINAILGMDEMILREAKDDTIEKYAAAIETSGRTLLALVNDILDFSKIESGKIDIIPAEYQLSSVLNDLMNMMAQRAEKKHLVLEIEVDSRIPDVLYGDEMRIRQVITNMLSNAIKYTDTGSVKLLVRFRWLNQEKKELELYIAVKDTGRGIKKEDQGKLFNSFERVDMQKNRAIEGTGLGLAITKKFVELMRGSVGVESVYGQGSKFFVRIPQKAMTGIPMGDYQEKFQKNVQKQKKYERSFVAPEARILLVDDNEINLMVEENLIKQTKVMVDTAASGKEALALLETKQYDLILLDHMMPEMDGIETLKQMQLKHLAAGVPVLVLTANAISGARDMYLEYGFQDYLSKPINGYHLEKALMKWLPSEKIQTVSEKPKKDSTEDQTEKKVLETMKLSRILDVEKALMYTNEGMQGVIENIRLYLEHENEYVNKLRQAYENGNDTNYRMSAHSLKSSSELIGANELSEFALSMENESKDSNVTYLKEHHEKFLQTYGQLCRHLEEFLASQPGQKKSEKKNSVTDTLQNMLDAVKNWDTVRASEEMKYLKEQTSSEGSSPEWVNRLSDAYKKMDFQQLQAILTECMNKK